MFATEVWQDHFSETAPEAEVQHNIFQEEEQRAADGTKLLPAKATPAGYSLSRDDSDEILNIRMKDASQ